MTQPVDERILDALGPALARRAGEQLGDLVAALVEPLTRVDETLRVTDRGWVAGIDLERTPVPAWLGVATGTRVPGGLSLEEQREYVRDRPSWRRGTPAAVKGAVRAVLEGGTRRVDLIERDGSPWRLKIRVWAVELPGYDREGPSTGQDAEARVVAAARTQVPVGIVVDDDVEVRHDNTTYEHFRVTHGTYAQLKTRFPTPAHTAAHAPEEGTPD